MNQNWHATLIRHLLLLITVCLIGGLVSGYYGWSLAIGLALYLGWTLKQLLRLHDWLRNHQPDEAPPDGYGLWGEVFDSIYHLQRRDQRVRGRLQAVIDRVQESTAALRDAVIMLDSDGNLEWWNRAAETLLGFKTPQDGGQPVTNLVRHPRFKEYFESENYAEPLEIPSPINDRLRVQLHLTRYGNNEHLMLVRDVTRIHQLEQMRKDFVANVSHELRTPLAVLRGELEAIQDGVRQFTPESVASLQAEVGTLTKLVDDLHQLSMSDEGALAYQKAPVDVINILEVVTGAFRERFASRDLKINLSLPDSAVVFGDRDRLMQLFNNLLENSLRYTDGGGALHISGRQENGRFALTFADSAPGVKDAQLEKLFERFYRTEGSRNRASGGSGLGLAICVNIVEAHGGTIRAAHSPFGGVSITVELPLERDLSREA